MGERLKGFVDGLPKPMVPVEGKPILRHDVEWLRRHGVTDISINLHHLPRMVTDYFGNGARFGVRISYSYESELLGTAGAVRKIVDECWQSREDRQFVVVYGDNLVDYDLEKICLFHLSHCGIVTIAFCRKDDAAGSGIGVLDSEGRVLSFVEKPKPEERISNLVNTGVYVLDREALRYMPGGTFLDFGRDIFPRMLQCGEALYGIETEGRLIAIDTPELYRAAQGK
jgi:NDP-sugar pyrophosphorylase family protein